MARNGYLDQAIKAWVVVVIVLLLVAFIGGGAVVWVLL